MKYNLIRDVERSSLVSVGATYFIPGATGAIRLRQGDFHLFLTGGKQILDRGHWISGTGFRLPATQLGHANVVLVEPVGLRGASTTCTA